MTESGTKVESLLDVINKQEQIIKKLEESVEIMHKMLDNRDKLIKILEFELKYTNKSE